VLTSIPAGPDGLRDCFNFRFEGERDEIVDGFCPEGGQFSMWELQDEPYDGDAVNSYIAHHDHVGRIATEPS
jgi:hypothetical protein